MGSTLSERSAEENLKNLERFTPLLYQNKKSGNAISTTHSMYCEIVGQEPGEYPYPIENRISSNETSSGEEEEIVIDVNPPCFNKSIVL